MNMDVRLLTFQLCCLWLPVVSPQEPVNQMFSVSAGVPTPDLACLVGFSSIDQDFYKRVNCSVAHEVEVPVSFERRKELKWDKKKKTIRFGTQDDNTPWPDPIASWVCSTTPNHGTVTFNCVPENQVPEWYKKEIAGPANGPYGRQPGCNGFVCYCNNVDYCNFATCSLPVKQLVLGLAVVLLRA